MRTVPALVSAGWERLLPAHRGEGHDQPVGAPRSVGELDLADGLVLVVVADERDRTYPAPLVVEGGRVHRARPGDGAAQALLQLLASGDSVPAGFRVSAWHHRTAVGERAISVDQTNESVVVGDAAVVKWSFLAEEGPHPAPSLLSLLDDAGFTGMPRPWAALEWEGRLVALAVDYVTGARDGWSWAVEDIASLDPRRARATGRAVGDLIADFHGALASTRRNATRDEVAGWSRDALADLDRALASSSSPVLTDHADEVRALLAAIPDDEVTVQRVHGDLHVGQVLRAGNDEHVLTDFDGNPVVPARERVRDQPVALDVAGMAQSFSHVGIVAARRHPALDPARVAECAAQARAAFLSACDPVEDGLVRAYSLRQVCREFTYAATHLPRWAYVPEAALPMLLRKDDT